MNTCSPRSPVNSPVGKFGKGADSRLMATGVVCENLPPPPASGTSLYAFTLDSSPQT